MKILIPISLLLVPFLALAQGHSDDSVAMLIRKLASGNFQERQQAFQRLQERPEAEQPLRAAMDTFDLETRRRAEHILSGYDRRPQLKAAVKEGRVDRFVDLLTTWSAGQHEREAWDALRDFSRTLANLHQKKGGAKIKLSVDRLEQWLPPVFCAKRITELTTYGDERTPYLRVGEVDLDPRRLNLRQRQNSFEIDSAAILATGSVFIVAHKSHVIVAGGSVEVMDSDGVWDTLIVSCGDVTLNCWLANSLVIARGKITCAGHLEGCHVIAGKSVVFTSDKVPEKMSIISENDPNPLGFIRWSESPKDKVIPKSK